MTSQMTQRLVQQLERRATLDAELLQQQRKLAQFAAEQQTLNAKSSAVTAERERLQALRTTLAQQHDSVIAAMHAREAADQVKRAKLSEELTARIKEVNQAVEQENQEWSAALSENARLKEKITVMKDSIATGSVKFAELLGTRTKETGSMQERAELIDKVNVELRQRTAAANAIIAEKRPEHDRVKAESDKFMARFAEIQAQLNAANGHFSKAKEDHTRLSKRIRQLESERDLTMRACERAKVERDMELAKEAKLEQEANTLVSQTQKILDVMALLSNTNKSKAAPEPAAAAAA